MLYLETGVKKTVFDDIRKLVVNTDDPESMNILKRQEYGCSLSFLLK